MAYELKKMPSFRIAIKENAIVNMINDNLGDKEIGRQFIADITSVVNNNPKLQECEAMSIISAGLVASSIDLPLSPALSFSYIVPRLITIDSISKAKVWKAQFQISWKGLVQLAIRSGYYQSIGTQEIREGELKGIDEFTGEEKFSFITDPKKRLSLPVIGYRAYFVLNSGFKKQDYWSNEQLTEHAKVYSKSYGSGKSTDLWKNNFEIMARKTVLRHLITQYGIMSVKMQKAMAIDQAVIEGNEHKYIDNPNSPDSEGYDAKADDDGVILPPEDETPKDNVDTTPSNPLPPEDSAPLTSSDCSSVLSSDFSDLMPKGK